MTDYTSFTDEQLENDRVYWRQCASIAAYEHNPYATRIATTELLAILNEMVNRGLHTPPRRHLAPERGRGRVGDTENGR